MAKGGHEQFDNVAKGGDNTNVVSEALLQNTRHESQVGQLDNGKHSPENAATYNAYLSRVASGDITAVDSAAAAVRKQYEDKVYSS